jgi:hypothetical protein
MNEIDMKGRGRGRILLAGERKKEGGRRGRRGQGREVIVLNKQQQHLRGKDEMGEA